MKKTLAAAAAAAALSAAAAVPAPVPAAASTSRVIPAYIATGHVVLAGSTGGGWCLSAPTLRKGGGVGIVKCANVPSQQWVLTRRQDTGFANPARDLRYALGAQPGSQKASLVSSNNPAFLLFMEQPGKNRWRIALVSGLSLSAKVPDRSRTVASAFWLRWQSGGYTQIWNLPKWKFVKD